jgi:hypothetical protein
MCAHCHTPNPAGALFCVACALPLAALPAVAAAGPPRPAPPPAGRPAVRLLEVENLQPTGRVLALPPTDWAGTLYLGRPDLAAGVVVDLDLTALGGYEKKVSRKHAKLHYVTRAGVSANEVRVEDWGSAHGTWRNKVRLAQGASEAIEDGDELRFAELVLRVAIT